MADATMTALAAAKPFVKSLGAKIGITPQIGKNPDAPYTYENFTTTDATTLVGKVKSDSDVQRLAFWSLNNDVTKLKSAFAPKFQAYTSS